MTVPSGTESWPAGSTQNLGWTLSSAAAVGDFGVWLVDAADGTKWYDAGFFAAEAGKTSYTPSFSTLGIPVGTYKAVVYYRADPGPGPGRPTPRARHGADHLRGNEHQRDRAQRHRVLAGGQYAEPRLDALLRRLRR